MLLWNTDTVLEEALAVASSAPVGLNATDTGYALPAAGGKPVTGVSAPSVRTENTDTVLGPELAVASSPLEG